jgi:hypothetical protein
VPARVTRLNTELFAAIEAESVLLTRRLHRQTGAFPRLESALQRAHAREAAI